MFIGPGPGDNVSKTSLILNSGDVKECRLSDRNARQEIASTLELFNTKLARFAQQKLLQSCIKRPSFDNA